jgi:TP901 family phage tail tape measure protein
VREIAKSGKYNVDVVIKVNDGDTKNKLSATEKYAKQTEKKLRTLGRIKASPSVKVNDRASSVVNRINNRMRSIKRSVSSTIKANDRASSVINRVKTRMASIINKPKDLILSAKDKVSDTVGRVKAKIQNLKAETIVKITGKAEQAMSTISRTQSKLKEFVGRKYQATVSLIDNASSALTGLDGKITSFTSGATRKFLALAAAAATAIGGIGVGSAVTGFASFEQSMKNVQAVSGATQQEFETLTKKARYMGATTKFTAKESADAFYYMGMAGWKTQDMLSGITGVLSLASAGQTDLALTSDIVTDGLTALGLTAKDTGMFVDTMAATVTNSNTNIEMMGETFKYVGSMGGALGVSMKDLSLATGLMASASVKGSMAGTALRGGLVRLINLPPEAAKAMKKYGIEISKTKDGNLDLAKTIGTLREKLGGLDGVTKSQAISSIFGRTAMAGWAAVVNASESDFNKLSKAIAESEGEAQRIADMKLDTIQGQWELLKSAVDEVRISVGDKLAPKIRGFIEGAINKVPKIGDAIVNVVDKFVNNFDKIKDRIQFLLPVIGMAVGALMLFKAGFGIVSLIVTFSKLAAALGFASASAMLAAASVYLIPIAIGAVIAIFAALSVSIANNKTVLLDLQNKFGDFGVFVGSAMEYIGGTIKLVFGTALKIIGGLAEAIGILFSGKSWAEKGSALKSLFKKTWADIKTSGREALSDMNTDTTTAIDLLRKSSSKQLEGVKNAFTVALDQTTNIAGQKSKQAADAIAKGLEGIDDNGLRVMRGLNDQMAIILSGVTADMDIKTKTDKIAQNLSDAFKAGKISAEEYKNGIIETMNFINQNCADSAGNIKQNLSDAFNAFKDGMQTGGINDAVTGMLNSINAAGPELQSVIQGMGGQMAQVFNGVDFSSPIEAQKSKVIANLQSMGLDGVEAVNMARTLFAEAAGLIPDEVANAVEPTGAKVSESMGNVPQSAAEGVQGTPEAIAAALGQGEGIVQESGVGLGQNVATGVTDGLQLGLPGVQAKGQELANATQEGAASAVNGSNAEWSNLGSGVDQGFNQATTAVQQGATNMYNGAKTSFSMLAQVGREAGSSLYNGMSTSLSMLGSNVRNAATSAYLGASTSFNQLAQVGRQAGSSLYNGVSTSMNMLSSNVKTAASSMYVGARTSFTALKTSAISSVTSMCSTITSKWQAMKAVVSAPITASFSVTTTQTTVKKTVNESGGGLWPFAKHAEGGIVNKTHIGMVGEAGPESIIPLSSARRSRGLALWHETGERLGVNVNKSVSNNTTSRVSNNNISKFEPRHQFADSDTRQERPNYQQAMPNNIINNKGNANNIDVNVIVNAQNTDNEAMIQETLARVEKELREALEDIS